MLGHHMRVGTRYIVVKGSDDGTFCVGDHLRLSTNGDVCCIEASGWIPGEVAAEAMIGMRVEVDAAWIARRKLELLAELISLDELGAVATPDNRVAVFPSKASE